jgi:hypothetical protein
MMEVSGQLHAVAALTSICIGKDVRGGGTAEQMWEGYGPNFFSNSDVNF